MNELMRVSANLADVVSGAGGSVALVHGARAEAASAVAWSKDLLVTAAHALEAERALEVTLAGSRQPASLVGADPASDLAVLRVDAELSPLPQADAARVRAGELVLALSRGQRGLKARLGIIARVAGEIRLGGGARVERYVETDIAPAPGLAGSALVGAAGELIGVNLTGLVRGQLVTLPAANVAPIVDALVAHGRVKRMRLGVALQRVELPRALAERLGQKNGLVVLSVLESGPAERGGLLLGDVILAVGGERVERVEDLQGRLAEHAAGSELALASLRAGEERAFTLTPEAQ